MADHMKTTVHIPDGLFADIQEIASREKTTLKALVQDGLQQVVANRKRRKPFRLRDASIAGTGLRPEMEGASWDAMLEKIYEGRGG